jgi:phage/plasmid-like protein (TIGR03299 family)
VAKVPLRLDDDGALPLSGICAVVRTDKSVSDRARVLEIVGEGYQPLQNWDAFAFFDHAVGQGQARYETAGAIDGGRRIWLLAALSADPICPVRDDLVIPYLLLANGHDGRLMVHMKFTPVRVVCQNTLAIALRDGDGRHISVRHDRLLRRHLGDTGEWFRTVSNTVGYAGEVWRGMAGRQMSARSADAFSGQCLAGPVLKTMKKRRTLTLSVRKRSGWPSR